MQTDISKVLAYEIKRELADRYFGFRKFIEQEKEALKQRVRLNTVTVEEKICHDLIRIYIMLRDNDLIERFFALTGLNEEIYYDKYAVRSPTIRKRVFSAVKAKGMTRSGRFKNLLFTCYGNLSLHVDEYRENISSMLVERETIVAEINLFYKKTDISQIMSFLRSIDSEYNPGSSLHQASVGLVEPCRFEEKMKLHPPGPLDQEFSNIHPVPPLALIKRELKKLAEQAYKRSTLLPNEY